jgi:hypothetical protein
MITSSIPGIIEEVNKKLSEQLTLLKDVGEEIESDFQRFTKFHHIVKLISETATEELDGESEARNDQGHTWASGD